MKNKYNIDNSGNGLGLKIKLKIKALNSGEPNSIREQYQNHGVDSFYKIFGAEYHNPHEILIKNTLDICLQKWDLNLDHVLDLCAGSGEITSHLLGKCKNIEALDPYTYQAFENRVGFTPMKYDFQQIANGALLDKRYSLIVCSFALHLASPSLLSLVGLNLAQITSQLLILSPHKKPVLKKDQGWDMQNELVNERVHAKLYKSNIWLK